MPVIVHTIILILAIGASFFLLNGPFAGFDLQITAFVFIIYTVFKKIFKKKSSLALFDSIVATFVISNIVNSTGGLSSPFFFLNYFLIFTLSLLLEPLISITTTLTLVFLYLLTTPENKPLVDFIPLFSLPFLTPFALFLGEQYRQRFMKGERLKDSQFFLALVIRKQLHRVRELTENFLGDHELTDIKKTVDQMEKTIDNYEKNT